MVNLGSTCRHSIWTATVDWVRIPSTSHTKKADSHLRNEGRIIVEAFNFNFNSFSGLITVANLFEPSVDGKVAGLASFTCSQPIYFIAAVNCIKAQIEASHGIIRVRYIFGADFGFILKPLIAVCLFGWGLCCFSLVIRVSIHFSCS
jgi:hypothetical protein